MRGAGHINNPRDDDKKRLIFNCSVPSNNQVHVLKAMRHPYIITYKESFMDKRCLCIVMDFADGGDLYTKIANQKKIGRGKQMFKDAHCFLLGLCHAVKRSVCSKLTFVASLTYSMLQ